MAEEMREEEATKAGHEAESEQAGEGAAQESEGAAQESEGREAEEAEMMARLQDEIRNLPVAEHLVYMMESLYGLAVGRLGATPETAALRDLDQARMAIDAFRALMDIIAPVRPAKEMTAHRGVLSQLQLAYVAALETGRAGEGRGEGSGSDAPSGSDASGSDAPSGSDASGSDAPSGSDASGSEAPSGESDEPAE